MEPRTVTAVVSAVVLGDDAVVFDVELLLRAGAVLAFDDVVGCGEDLVEVGCWSVSIR